MYIFPISASTSAVSGPTGVPSDLHRRPSGDRLRSEQFRRGAVAGQRRRSDGLRDRCGEACAGGVWFVPGTGVMPRSDVSS